MPAQEEGAMVVSSVSWSYRMKATTGPHSWVQGRGYPGNSRLWAAGRREAAPV